MTGNSTIILVITQINSVEVHTSSYSSYSYEMIGAVASEMGQRWFISIPNLFLKAGITISHKDCDATY